MLRHSPECGQRYEPTQVAELFFMMLLANLSGASPAGQWHA